MSGRNGACALAAKVGAVYFTIYRGLGVPKSVIHTAFKVQKSLQFQSRDREIMTNRNTSNGSIQRKKVPSDDELPREKLPKDLQNLVNDQENLIEHIYDGTYVPGNVRLLPVPSILTFPSVHRNLQIQTFDMRHMQPVCERYFSLLIDTLHILPILESPFGLSLIRG